MDDNWHMFAGGVAVGLTGVATVFLTGMRKWVEVFWRVKARRLAQKNYARGLHGYAVFRDVVESLHGLSFVDRILIMNGRNGGGLPRAGKPFKVRSIDSWSRVPEKVNGLNDLYGYSLLIDDHYAVMIQEMIEKGSVIMTTEQLPACKLKEYYSAEGVSQSVLYFLNIEDRVLSFISIARYADVFKPTELVQLGAKVARLRSLMEDDN